MNYDDLLNQAIREGDASDYPRVAAFLIEMIVPEWLPAYKQSTRRTTELERIDLNGFAYIFDNYSACVDRGDCEASAVEDRLVGVIGLSSRQSKKREASRLRGWLGPNSEMPIKERDKGHFIAHSIGGLVDGFEINLYVQRRDFNRGRSVAGKVYRKMETHCANNPGTLLFSRPMYTGRLVHSRLD